MIGRINNIGSKDCLILITEGCFQDKVDRYLGRSFMRSSLFPILCNTEREAVELYRSMTQSMVLWASVIKGETTWEEINKKKEKEHREREEMHEEFAVQLETTFVW